MSDIDINALLLESVVELRRRFGDEETPIPEELLTALASDARAGARHLAVWLRRRRARWQREDERLEKMLKVEKELWSDGYKQIAGVDEAGVGPLAGPVVAAAVILPQGCKIRGVNDSKKIPQQKQREELEKQIKAVAVAWAVGSADAAEIDRMNIYRAALLAMRRAVDGLPHRPDYLLTDTRKIPGLTFPQEGIVHGDARSLSIAAASILAKTHRDRLMQEMDALYPGYGLATHKGYPTPEHIKALNQLGASPIHRRSYTPVKISLGLLPRQLKLFPDM